MTANEPAFQRRARRKGLSLSLPPFLGLQRRCHLWVRPEADLICECSQSNRREQGVHVVSRLPFVNHLHQRCIPLVGYSCPAPPPPPYCSWAPKRARTHTHTHTDEQIQIGSGARGSPSETGQRTTLALARTCKSENLEQFLLLRPKKS